jgi:hypothetical protein
MIMVESANGKYGIHWLVTDGPQTKIKAVKDV